MYICLSADCRHCKLPGNHQTIVYSQPDCRCTLYSAQCTVWVYLIYVRISFIFIVVYDCVSMLLSDKEWYIKWKQTYVFNWLTGDQYNFAVTYYNYSVLLLTEHRPWRNSFRPTRPIPDPVGTDSVTLILQFDKTINQWWAANENI